MNPIDRALFQQVFDVLAREAQGLPYARADQGLVLDEAVDRRGAHLQVSGQVLDRAQWLDPQSPSSLASCGSLLAWLFGEAAPGAVPEAVPALSANRYSVVAAIVPDPRQLI